MEVLSQKGSDIGMIIIEFCHLHEVFLTVIMDNLFVSQVNTQNKVLPSDMPSNMN